MISLIVATDIEGAIADSSGKPLPWKMPSDMGRFRAITKGTACIMGRKTAATLPKPLHDRTEIVMSRHEDVALPEHQFHAKDVAHALALAMNRRPRAPEVCVIGGGEIYSLFLPYADKIYLTTVRTQIAEPIAWHPSICVQQWTTLDVETYHEAAEGGDEFDSTFTTLVRRWAR